MTGCPDKRPDGTPDRPGPTTGGNGMIRIALVSVLCVLAILMVMPQVIQANDSLYEQKMARGVLAFESGKFPEAEGENRSGQVDPATETQRPIGKSCPPLRPAEKGISYRVGAYAVLLR